MRRNVLVKLSRLYHHRPDHVVGYEQTVDLLHDTDSFLGANGRVRGTLWWLFISVMASSNSQREW
jgi:hypothetical protein